MTMIFRKISSLATLLLFFYSLGFAGQDWGYPVMPLSEVKPGMKGIGKTVFYGNKIETFGVEVLDIVRNFYPKHDIILARLTGKKAEYTGVVSGMSGSPIYIDGKLVGALAYRFGQFMKEPIAGIMPFEDMIAVAQKEAVRDQEVVPRASLLPHYLKATLVGADENFWQQILSTLATTTPTANFSLTRIQSPIIFSGFSDNIIREYQDLFANMGFVAIPGGSQPAEEETSDQEIKPGSAISQVFIHGDLGINATGTVTAVKDNRLLAFGHFIFNLGAINMPLARTRILATLPSLMGSNKMAVSSDIIGSFLQDRVTGLYGELAKAPNLIPVYLKHNSKTDGIHEYRFSMASDRSLNNLLPFYLRIALLQGMTVARLSAGESTLHLKGKIVFDDNKTLDFEDYFSTYQRLGFFAPGNDATEASNLISALIGVLLVNDFNPPGIARIDLTTDVTPGQKIARIHTIWQDKTEMKPGETLNLNIRLKTTGGKDLKFVRSLKLPENLDASSLSIIISSANSLMRYEMRVTPDKFRPVSFDNLLSILRKRRKNNKLYIQVRIKDSGMILEGEELSDLPPSIMGIMNSRRSSGASQRLRDRVLLEDVITTDYVITGSKRLSVRIIQPQKARKPEKDKDEKLQMLFW